MMRMMPIRGLATCCLGFALLMRGQSPAVTPLVERIHEAEGRSLAALSEKPWHLKVDATLFDEKGNNPQQGTMEVWNDGDKRRIVWHFGDSTLTRVSVGAKVYRSSTGEAIPYQAEELLGRILHPGPSQDDFDTSQPELRKQSFGKTSLDCVMLSRPINRLASAPIGLFPTYCFSPETSNILVSFDFGTEAFVVRSSGRFLDHYVPLKLELENQKGAKVANAAVSSLTSYEPGAEDFTPPANASAGTGLARISGGVIEGNLLTKATPVYPASAKANHVSGVVILRATVGTDGHVHAVRPMSAPDPDLAVAAIAAVRQWTYKPYLLNGEPTSVDTTITVNFTYR